MTDGSQISEDGDIAVDVENPDDEINFAERLQQFEQTQSQHRMHAIAQAQLHNTSTSVSKVAELFILPPAY